jgi:1-acyl-sn-glycerol-3-phosphate acyltransferase
MEMKQKTPPKPKSEKFRPEITRLPVLTLQRRIFRRLVKWLAQAITWLFCKVKMTGFENYPAEGAALLVANHLGDADVVVGLAYSPRPLELIVKSEIFDFPILGWVFEQYGVIWIHRGQPDRRALRAAIQALDQGRLVCIAPEARESLSGSLEEGTRGAAYLAHKSRAPILPVTYTQTENWRILENLNHFKKTEITITIGKAFHLTAEGSQKNVLDAGTQDIMQHLASQLPEHYRGVYLSQRNS